MDLNTQIWHWKFTKCIKTVGSGSYAISMYSKLSPSENRRTLYKCRYLCLFECVCVCGEYIYTMTHRIHYQSQCLHSAHKHTHISKSFRWFRNWKHTCPIKPRYIYIYICEFDMRLSLRKPTITLYFHLFTLSVFGILLPPSLVGLSSSNIPVSALYFNIIISHPNKIMPKLISWLINFSLGWNLSLMFCETFDVVAICARREKNAKTFVG